MALAGAAGLALRLRDPHVQGSWGVCPSAALGFSCPGCGSLRAGHLLAQGDLPGAVSSNLLLVLALVAGVLWWGAALVRTVRGSARPWRLRRLPTGAWMPLGAVALVLVVAFTLARNLPALGTWAAWLAP